MPGESEPIREETLTAKKLLELFQLILSRPSAADSARHHYHKLLFGDAIDGTGHLDYKKVPAEELKRFVGLLLEHARSVERDERLAGTLLATIGTPEAADALAKLITAATPKHVTDIMIPRGDGKPVAALLLAERVLSKSESISREDAIGMVELLTAGKIGREKAVSMLKGGEATEKGPSHKSVPTPEERKPKVPVK